MESSDLIQPLYVFIASPGDVEDEREAIRELVAELNGSLRKKGWEISLLGWEDRGPTGGRAQADINEDVKRCDVFVGIAWKRWGAPTGDHSSGFAEEWSIARDRHKRSGRPDLWLYFKKVPEGIPEDDQLRSVRELRREVEDGELAFYKTFEGVADFARLLRARLLDEVLERSGLTRTDLGGPALDWGAAYRQEPVDLLPDGRNRAALADELEQSRPEEAAKLLGSLADDAEERGFDSVAENLRIRACRVWVGGGDSNAAVALLRTILQRHIWELRLEDADMLLRQLRDDMPPELASELRGWTACIAALSDPADAAETLGEVIGEEHAFQLDSETIVHWRCLQWRCLLDTNQAQKVVDDDTELDPKRGGVHLELAFLRADALRVVRPDDADKAWADLRLLAIDQATEHPGRAAWISTRAALDAVAQEDLDTAEAAYADAATRWTKVGGASTNSALAFFAAQAASRLRRDWSFTGWGWRPMAAAQIGRATGPAARAEELERLGQSQLISQKYEDAIEGLRGALWCYLRAGLLDGVMRSRQLLASVHAEAGQLAPAVVCCCMVGDSARAGKLASRAEEPATLVAQMAGSWPGWAAEARFAVIARIGSHARPPVVDELAAEAVAATRSESEGAFDNTQTGAAEALASLAVAVEDENVLRVVVTRLMELATERHYALAQSGRLGLRMLDDVGRVDAGDALIRCFLADDRPDEPTPAWVAEHLTEPPQLDRVRQAALGGHRYALLALIEAGSTGNDADLKELCARITRKVLQTDLGMTPDGKGMHGLMALEIQASIAVASGDDELIQSFGEVLRIYASESRWPMVNRVSAVRGLLKVADKAAGASWLETLRPLATPEADHDEEAAPYLRDMGSRPGDLESIALAVAAKIASARVDWLDSAINEAGFDRRPALREASWFAAGQQPFWFDVNSARYALRDDTSSVRAAAVNAWRRQGPPLSSSEAHRLAKDPSWSVRLALLRSLAESPVPEVNAKLCDDSDAYVRGIARKELGVENKR
jgi:hypothetical protein